MLEIRCQDFYGEDLFHSEIKPQNVSETKTKTFFLLLGDLATKLGNLVATEGK